MPRLPTEKRDRGNAQEDGSRCRVLAKRRGHGGPEDHAESHAHRIEGEGHERRPLAARSAEARHQDPGQAAGHDGRGQRKEPRPPQEHTADQGSQDDRQECEQLRLPERSQDDGGENQRSSP
jgi:hypothetical protein